MVVYRPIMVGFRLSASCQTNKVSLSLSCLPKKTNWYIDLMVEIIYHETNIIGFNFIISIIIEMTNNIKCRDKGPRLYIGPWTLAEDVDWSENE